MVPQGHMIVVVAHQGTGLRFLKADLAGRPFASHLPAKLLSLQERGAVVIDIENPFPGQPNTVDAELVDSHDLLLVAADAWFSAAALEQLLSLIAMNRGMAKSICGEGKEIEDRDEQDALAVYLPARAAAILLDRHGLPVLGQGLANVSRGLDCNVIPGRALDPVRPPVRIKNLLDLAILERSILHERACAALLTGIRIRDPDRIEIRGELRCGSGVEIDVNVIIEGTVTLGEGVKIGANSILTNSTIGSNTRVHPFSIVEDAVIGSNTIIGPYGRVRPGSIIGDSAQIGNFVEIKNSEVGSGSRINHLAFIGDAKLERNVTIGAGSITCNHNGVGVSRTEIKAGAYVGSGCKLVAPLSIGENATIGAGSTITRDAPAGKLTLARSRQVTVENWTRVDNRSDDA